MFDNSQVNCREYQSYSNTKLVLLNANLLYLYNLPLQDLWIYNICVDVASSYTVIPNTYHWFDFIYFYYKINANTSNTILIL